jgi:hypothetical protein
MTQWSPLACPYEEDTSHVLAEFSDVRIKHPLSKTAPSFIAEKWFSELESFPLQDAFGCAIIIDRGTQSRVNSKPSGGYLGYWLTDIASEIQHLDKVKTILSNFYAKAGSEHEYNAASYLYSNIDMWASKRDFNVCNLLIKKIDLSNINTFFICSLARYLFPLSKSLKFWKTFLIRAESEIQTKGENPAVLLFGLTAEK